LVLRGRHKLTPPRTLTPPRPAPPEPPPLHAFEERSHVARHVGGTAPPPPRGAWRVVHRPALIASHASWLCRWIERAVRSISPRASLRRSRQRPRPRHRHFPLRLANRAWKLCRRLTLSPVPQTVDGHELSLYPCGLFATSLFNDSFTLYRDTTRIDWTKHSIAWPHAKARFKSKVLLHTRSLGGERRRVRRAAC